MKNTSIFRLRRVKMEKRTFADQSNSIVDLSKVREASDCITMSGSARTLDHVAPKVRFTCAVLADAEPGVRRAIRGAGLPGRTGLPHLHPGEERGGAEGGLQEPPAAPLQHAFHTELLHPPPPQGEGGENRNTAGQSSGGLD